MVTVVELGLSFGLFIHQFLKRKSVVRFLLKIHEFDEMVTLEV
jgi:hypothetical protein